MKGPLGPVAHYAEVELEGVLAGHMGDQFAKDTRNWEDAQGV